tara:strand:- start:7204 stop:7602 length:399 start_codon:yes stop_codon:yes gene_type:complete
MDNSFKSELLLALDQEFGITPHEIAEGLAQVIRGETTKEKYSGDDNLVSREVTRNPRDIMQGAMIYDSLRGGDLGIAPASLRAVKSRSGEIVHKRLGVDERIVANSDLNRLLEPVEEVEVEVSLKLLDPLLF